MNLDLQRLIRRDARRIASTYLLVAAAWIWGSDYLLRLWFPDPATEAVLQTFKGIVFVLVTSLLLYLSVRGQLLQRTTIEQVLRSTRSLGEAIFHSANDAILVLDERYNIRDVNLKAERLYARSRADLIGMPLASLRASAASARVAADMRAVIDTGSGQWETTHRRSDGTEFPVEVSTHVLEWDGAPNYVHMVRDISKRREYQDRIERLNRVYAVLSDVNQMIVRVRDRETLFREACRIAIEKGRFRLAWIGEVDEATKSVRVVTSSGPAIGYLEGMTIAVDAGEHSRGPTAMAYARGSYVVSNDIERDHRMGPWQDRAREHGLRASAAFPIKRGNVTAFILNVYAGEAGHFDDREIELLDEMASDITFALAFNDTMRRLEENEAVTRAFMDHMPGLAFIKDPERRYLFVNRTFERSIGHSGAAWKGRRVDEVLETPEADLIAEHDRQVLSTGQPLLVEEVVVVDGVPRQFLASKFAIQRPDGPAWLGGIAIDVTERKRIERELQKHEALLSRVIETMPVGVWIQDPAGRLVSGNEAGRQIWGGGRFVGIEQFGEYKGRWVSTGKPVEPHEWAAARAIRNRETSIDEEIEIECFDGSRKTILNSAVPIIGSRGELLGAVIVNQDITERRRAEMQLHRQAELLRQMERIAKIGAWEFDPVTGKGTWTEGVARIHDLDPSDEATVQPGLTFYTGEDRERIERAVRRAIEFAEPYDLELMLTTARGERRWVHTIGTPLIKDGRVVKVHGSFQDVTDRKKAEETMARQDRVLRLFVEHAPAGIAMFDREMRYLLASRRYLADYGIAEHDITGRSHYEVFPEIPERWKEVHRRCLAGGIERAEEDPFLRKDGHVDVVRWELRPWFERDNLIGGLMLFSEVVTERKRIEKNLMESERRYRSLFENMTSGFVLFEVVTDKGDRPVDLIILAANAGFEATTGLKATDVAGKTLREALPGIEHDAADWIGTYGSIALHGGSRQFEQRSDLLGVHYSVTAFQSSARQCAVTFTDVTDRKRAELEREEMTRRLRALAQQLVSAREEERKTIAREIHDELGQELTAIRMDLSMAAGTKSLNDVHEQLASAVGVTDRAIATVRRLARELRPDVLDQLGLEEALKWLASEHESHTRVPCRVRVEGDTHGLDDTTSTTLFRVVQESLTNVIRHAQARSVEILLRSADDIVELEISDDGRGPEAARLARPSGVGITGMRERVEALGGTFEIGPRAEGGTRVAVRLPVGPTPRQEASP